VGVRGGVRALFSRRRRSGRRLEVSGVHVRERKVFTDEEKRFARQLSVHVGHSVAEVEASRLPTLAIASERIDRLTPVYFVEGVLLNAELVQ
jgi:hypothetical protein